MSGSFHFLFIGFWSVTIDEKISWHVCLSFKKESTKNDSDQKTRNEKWNEWGIKVTLAVHEVHGLLKKALSMWPWILEFLSCPL